LRCLESASGAFGLDAFAGDAFTVQSGFGNQVERVRRESEFVLRDRQAASASSHCVLLVKVAKLAQRGSVAVADNDVV
jgi:hypothetical protein